MTREASLGTRGYGPQIMTTNDHRRRIAARRLVKVAFLAAEMPKCNFQVGGGLQALYANG